MVEALGYSCDDFQSLNLLFNIFEHRREKIPVLDERGSTEERLQNLVLFGDREKLLALPKLDNSTGEEQTEVISNVTYDWELNEKVQIMCYATAASSTSRVNGVWVLLGSTYSASWAFYISNYLRVD